jgi:hypothetical protein
MLTGATPGTTRIDSIVCGTVYDSGVFMSLGQERSIGAPSTVMRKRCWDRPRRVGIEEKPPPELALTPGN